MITNGGKIGKLYFGDKELKKAMFGSVLVYGYTEPYIYIRTNKETYWVDATTYGEDLITLYFDNKPQKCSFELIGKLSDGTYDVEAKIPIISGNLYRCFNDLPYGLTSSGQSLRQTKIEINDLSGNLTNLSYLFSKWSTNPDMIDTNKIVQKLDIKNLNTINVTDMSYMFCMCHVTDIIGLNNLNTANVVDMSGMFNNASFTSRTLDLSNFNTHNVTNMSGMFNDLSLHNRATLDVSSFDTSNVTNMSKMFKRLGGENSNIIGLENFDTRKVTNMDEMFYMFNGASLNLSSFDVSNVTSMSDMFYYCNNLTTITCTNNFRDWCISNADEISLPSSFRNNNYSGWEITD